MWFFFPSTVSSKVITCKVNHMVCIYLLFSVQGIFYDILLFNNQLIICTHLLQLGGFQEKLTNKKKIVEYWATNLCLLWNLSLSQIKSIAMINLLQSTITCTSSKTHTLYLSLGSEEFRKFLLVSWFNTDTGLSTWDTIEINQLLTGEVA